MTPSSSLHTITPDAPSTHDTTHAYRQAGVDLHAANAVVGIAKKHAQRTPNLGLMLGGIGGFSGAFRLPAGMEAPVLLAACDGVGTKLAVAQWMNQHHSIGIDLVAMSVNDLLTQGGRPLVFLDYLATGKLDLAQLDAVLAGVAEGCRQADCHLLGGETAEMPSFYQEHPYDLAGFAIGVVEEAHLLPNKQTMQAGDVVLGIGSQGLHANGYSLARSIVSEYGLELTHALPNDAQHRTLGEALLTPTAIYVQPLLAVLQQHRSAIRGMVHITGGGFQDNLPRVLPPHLAMAIDVTAWPWCPLASYLGHVAGLSVATLLHTFNCGVGFTVIVSADEADTVQATLDEACRVYTSAYGLPNWGVTRVGAVIERTGMPNALETDNSAVQLLNVDQASVLLGLCH